jgi:hypothetical protein
MKRITPSSKATNVNPKDLLGNKKVSITKLPFVALIHGAHAMMDGAVKYGPYNWRSKPVIASIYVDAAARHLLAWFEGEEIASDSGVHHLGHAIACAGILLDAMATGNLVDDRPGDGTVIGKILDELSKTIVAKREAREASERNTARAKKSARTRSRRKKLIEKATEPVQVLSGPGVKNIAI